MKLNRTFNQRKALIRTQLRSFIENGKITTTESKAKMIKPLIDRMISKAKVDSVHIRRLLAKDLGSSKSANRLVTVIAPLFPETVSGFTTSVKDRIRRGDGVTMVALKLAKDLPKVEVVAKPKADKKVVKAKESKPVKKEAK